MTRKPTRRTVERAIDRLEGDDGADALDSGPTERKAHIGRHPAENMPLPDDAREHVERRALTFDDAEDAADALDHGPTGPQGWDVETALEGETEQTDSEGDHDAEG